MPHSSDYYIDLTALQKIGDKDGLHSLDTLPLLPFQPAARTNAGRRFRRIIVDTIDQMLSETDRFSRTSEHEYIFYLGPNRKLAEMKLDLMRKEIVRRIECFVQEKYLPTPLLNQEDSAPPEKKPEPPPERWKPPVEDLPRKVKSDPEMRKLADQAMAEMLSAREGKKTLVQELRESGSLNILYNPVWNVPKNHLTAFIATADNEPQNEGQRSYLRDRAQFDLALFLQATAALEKLIAEGGKVILIIPVSLATLDSYPFRNLYLQCCAGLSDIARTLVVLKIEKIEKVDQELTTQALDDILREPAGLVRTLILSTTLQNKNFNGPVRTPIHGYSISLAAEPGNERKIFTQLDRFAEILESRNKASLVENIHKMSLLGGAIGAGASYVCGPAIQPLQPTLDRVSPFDLVRAYENFAATFTDLQEIATDP